MRCGLDVPIVAQALQHEVALLGEHALSEVIPQRFLKRYNGNWVGGFDRRVHFRAGRPVGHLDETNDVELVRADQERRMRSEDGLASAGEPAQRGSEASLF